MNSQKTPSQTKLWIAIFAILVVLVGGVLFLFWSPPPTTPSSPASQNQSGGKTGTPDATSKTGIGGDGPVEQPKAPLPTGAK